MCGSTLKKVVKYALPAAAIAAPFLAPAAIPFSLSAPTAAAIGGGLATTGGRLAIGQEPGEAFSKGLMTAGAASLSAPLLAKGAGAIGFGGTSGTGSLAAKGVTGALPDVGSTIPQLAEAGTGAGAGTTLPSISGVGASAVPAGAGGASTLKPVSLLPFAAGVGAGAASAGEGGAATLSPVTPNPIAIAPGVDYIGPPSAGEGGASTLSPVEIPEGSGGPLSFLKKNKTLPILAGTQLFNTFAQKDMLEGLNEAQGASYADYLKSINPPEAVKEARFREAKSNIANTATTASRRLSNTLAARGIRGKGTASPTAGFERSRQKAENTAYNQIFGEYNVPSVAPPVNYTPDLMSLLGKNVSDIGTLIFLSELARSA